jgi:hypothetical protein
MIGDKYLTEFVDSYSIRVVRVVGERDQCSEAKSKEEVERWSVRMQTRVAINQMRILVA